MREKNRSSAGLGLVLPLGPFDDSSFKSMIVILGVFAHDDGSCRSLYFFQEFLLVMTAVTGVYIFLPYVMMGSSYERDF